MSDNNKHVSEVSIEIGNNLYARLESIKNTPSHVLAEFIDNALQSYIDNKEELLAHDPNYKLKVEINFYWAERDELSSVTIKDNAAGMTWDKFLKAFPLASTPDDNRGLNEFGMGMKTAALWLGYRYTVTSTAIGEDVEREVCFDLSEVTGQSMRTLPVNEKEVGLNSHYTEVTIVNFTKNAPSSRVLPRVNKELADIYRKQLRNGEMEVIVNGQTLYFEEYPILEAAFVRAPESPSIVWKKEIDISFRRYKAKGFIAILREMNKYQNGLVLMRRGRVVVGAEEENRYFPPSLFGNVGSPRYKRLFGELELEGFSVSFNKDGLMETEDLAALMDVIKSQINTAKLNLYVQAEEYRPDNIDKKVRGVVKGHTKGKKDKDSKPSANSGTAKPKTLRDGSAISTDILNEEEGDFVIETPATKSDVNRTIYDWTEEFVLDDTTYKMKVMFVEGDKDLLWLNTRDEDKKIFECKINVKHPFFEVFSKERIDKSAIAVLRAIAMAKFSANRTGGDISEMFEYFNAYIRDIKA